MPERETVSCRWASAPLTGRHAREKRLLPEQLTAAIPFMLEINPIIALDAFFGKPRTVDGTGERETMASA